MISNTFSATSGQPEGNDDNRAASICASRYILYQLSQYQKFWRGGNRSKYLVNGEVSMKGWLSVIWDINLVLYGLASIQLLSMLLPSRCNIKDKNWRHLTRTTRPRKELGSWCLVPNREKFKGKSRNSRSGCRQDWCRCSDNESIEASKVNALGGLCIVATFCIMILEIGAW